MRTQLTCCDQAAVRRTDIRKENPNMSFGDCGKQIGEEWRAMPDDVKAPYIAKAQASLALYKQEKAAYGMHHTSTKRDIPCACRSC